MTIRILLLAIISVSFSCHGVGETGMNDGGDPAANATTADSGDSAGDAGDADDAGAGLDGSSPDASYTGDTGDAGDRRSIILRQKKAFPTAEGDGALATAEIDDTWEVRYVTENNGTGAGTFDDVLNDQRDRVIVLFAVGGNFDSEGLKYTENHDGLIIAGQTANDLGGVHFINSRQSGDSRLYFHQIQNYQVRYIDIKQGWWMFEGGSVGRHAPVTCAECYNGIVDHYSGGWGSYIGWGSSKLNPRADDRGGRYTEQRFLGVESVRGHNVGHAGGGVQADYVRSAYPADRQDEAWSSFEDISFHHSLYVGMTHRAPTNTSGNSGVVRRAFNYIYGWSTRMNRHTMGAQRIEDYRNIFHSTLDSNIDYARMNKFDTHDYYNMNYEGAGGTYLNDPKLNFFSEETLILNRDGTVFHAVEDDDLRMWTHFRDTPHGTGGEPLDDGDVVRFDERSSAAVPITTHSLDELKTNLVENVGSSVRFRPDGTTYYDDPIDQMYIDFVAENTAPNQYSDSDGDGGWGDTARMEYIERDTQTRDLDQYDADRDGLPDEWEALHQVSDPWAVKSDWVFDGIAVDNQAGYNNLQMFLADKAGDFNRWYLDNGYYAE